MKTPLVTLASCALISFTLVACPEKKEKVEADDTEENVPVKEESAKATDPVDDTAEEDEGSEAEEESDEESDEE